ncbi:MAG: helix-turn-helix transcriptional regulator [Gammaproteobacteria bacterium]|uniref:ArsR/SmtB family transcription factor n=1 Tax=Pseudomaricurvus alcaniphilus TaxID=1166482 RepID=UPI00140AAAD3|nr:helix-turn-helix transcriptional regulator [Pseudomaricurvus alcaniphilus]MBR9911978.1 helix-turn-helix transcriptional regulator [Gammaproteobacteria bacterium]NHN38401.1 helix-turn-helix transcriptional regulator [Pseudomaricurvus alcaniphilus]
MELKTAVTALAALAQETRLTAFRLLIRHGSVGLPAGDIARALQTPHNTMSSHLSILSNAGLISSQRSGRSIIYKADQEGIRNLVSFLVEDCCQGQAELCAPLLDSLLPACCEPADQH